MRPFLLWCVYPWDIIYRSTITIAIIYLAITRDEEHICPISTQDKTAIRIALSNRYTTGGEFPLLERVEFVIGAKSIRPDAGALSFSIRNTDKNGLIIIHSPPKNHYCSPRDLSKRPVTIADVAGIKSVTWVLRSRVARAKTQKGVRIFFRGEDARKSWS